MDYSHPGYEMRQRAVSKKEIISLKKSIDKIKCDIDKFIPSDAQLFKFDWVEHNFILFHQSFSFHILAFVSKEEESSSLMERLERHHKTLKKDNCLIF